MKNQKKLVGGMLVLVLVFGLTAVGCEEDPPEETKNESKTLVITMPSSIFEQGLYGFQIGVFPVGTSLDDAMNWSGIVAGANQDTPNLSYTDIGNDKIKLTVPLYNVYTNRRWSGSGTYDIYAGLNSALEEHYYKAGSVNFSSAITSISIDSSNEVN